MAHDPRQVPDTVRQAASQAWAGWSARIAALRPARKTGSDRRRGPADLSGSVETAEARMIAKIRKRMREYPDWYETDPARVAALVTRDLERIGGVLEHEFARTDQPVEVWRVPLSVFNWLVDGPEGPRFVRGALKAWSSAQCFNAASGACADEDQAARLRAPFLEIAPLRLKAVLGQLFQEDFRVTFQQVYVGAEFKFLGLRVQRPD